MCILFRMCMLKKGRSLPCYKDLQMLKKTGQKQTGGGMSKPMNLNDLRSHQGKITPEKKQGGLIHFQPQLVGGCLTMGSETRPCASCGPLHVSHRNGGPGPRRPIGCAPRRAANSPAPRRRQAPRGGGGGGAASQNDPGVRWEEKPPPSGKPKATRDRHHMGTGNFCFVSLRLPVD